MDQPRSFTNEMPRSKPIHGGKKTCCRCDEPHAPGSGYCKAHKAEYMRGWRATRTAEFHRLRQLVGAQNE